MWRTAMLAAIAAFTFGLASGALAAPRQAPDFGAYYDEYTGDVPSGFYDRAKGDIKNDN